MVYAILIALIIIGGFSIISPVRLVWKNPYEANKKNHKFLIGKNKELETVNKTLIEKSKKNGEKISDLEHFLQELGTENDNLKEEIKFHRKIGEKAGAFVEASFQNILTTDATNRLQRYTKATIIQNFQSTINRTVEGLKTVDFTRM